MGDAGTDPYTVKWGTKEGKALYELSNYLGNVVATINGRHNGDLQGEVASMVDYYPFGMIMPGRSYTLAGSSYRYGFNGQEKSDEINGEGNSYTAEFWQYDSRTGRRWNIDPKPYVGISEYATLGNNPILNVDPKGDLFFGLFGSSSEQRQSARSFQREKGGNIRNYWRSDISVQFQQTYRDGNGYFTVGMFNQRFRKDGRLDYGERLNKLYDDEAEQLKQFWFDHKIDRYGISIVNQVLGLPPIIR